MSRVRASILLLAAAAVLWAAGPAKARWSRPVAIAAARANPSTQSALAVDGRGDTALAWATARDFPPRSRWRGCALAEHPRPDCFPIVTIRVALYTANHLKLVRTLWHAREAGSMRIAVALARGEATVAWSYSDPGARAQTLRAAYGPLQAAWRPSRVLARFSDVWFTGGRNAAYPQLAVAPDGTVLLAWAACRSPETCPRPVGGVEVASRAPHVRFGPASLIRRAPEGARAVFDVKGSAYLFSPCSGRVLVASPGGLSFDRVVTLSRGPVSDLSLSVSGPGEGLASWVGGACSTDQAVGDAPGPLYASLLKRGVFAKASILTPGGVTAFFARGVAVRGGGLVSWRTLGSDLVAVPHLAFVGEPGPFATVPAGSEPVAADGGGDVLLSSASIWPTEPPVETLLPRAGAPPEAAAAGTGVLAVAPFARVAADAWFASGRLELSVWRAEGLP